MLFGSSGIRQKYGPDLVHIAQRTGSAVATSAGSVMVGRDTRTTSGIIAGALISGLLGSGATVEYCGIVPTPTVAYGARKNAAGAMITASHNPEEYNGIKLFNPDGSSFARAQQAETERLVEVFHWTGWKNQGICTPVDAITPHLNAILDMRSTGRMLHAILDCGSGAGCTLTPQLLCGMGITTTCLNCTPEGHFPRPSEPNKESLRYVPEMIRKAGADCAVAHDGDADRMVAFDGSGHIISGDHVLMLFARYLGAKRVVTTFDASMAIDEVAEVRRTPVGDSYVSEALLSWGDFGGEPSGAWIFPEISLCPDGPYAAALLCEIASEWDLAEETGSMPTYPILRKSFPCKNAREIVSALGAENPTDGLRQETEEGWCLIRASGTEPKIRITAEGKTLPGAKAMMEQGRTMVAKQRKSLEA
jgi:phosphoglucosamine mutase